MNWYEPGEDSYTFLDTLILENIKGKTILDMGCSTGIITHYLENHNLVISSDINVLALQELDSGNKIRMDLFKGINQKKLDICVFNPPYVPDYDCPILGGGKHGREIIDRFVSSVDVSLFYILIIKANRPLEIARNIERRGYSVSLIKTRKIIGETILILKCQLRQ